MVRKFKIAALAGALMMAITPAMAQEDPLAGLGDLDPMKMLNPQPAPAAAPAKPMMKKKMMGKKKMMMKKPMMKKKMMGKKMMMKKSMMKKKM